MRAVLVCYITLGCLILGSLGASLTTQYEGGTIDVGVWSDYAFITANAPPNASITVTVTEATGTCTFTATSFTMGPQVQSVSFQVKSTVSGFYTVDYNIEGDTVGQFFPGTGSLSFTFTLRSINVDYIQNSVFVDEPSEPVKLYIETPSTGDLTFVPTPDDPSISFSSPIVIRAGSLSTSFSFIATTAIFYTYVNWTVTGGESALYDNELASTIFFQMQKRNVITPLFSKNVLLSAESTILYVYTEEPVNNSLTVTPQAADTTFSPSTFTFSPSSQVAAFTFDTTTPSSSKAVNFYLSGADQYIYGDIETAYLNIPKRTITVVYPSVFILTNTTYISIMLTAPAVSSVTVSFYAANVRFNTTSVTFSGNQTTFAVAVYPFFLGQDTLSFLISGNDVDYYEDIADIPIKVLGGQFEGPAGWYVPQLWVGEESDPIPIRAAWSPINEVTLTMSAPDVKFNPPTLTFRNGSEQQYFTITPLYVSNDGTTYPSITVSFLVSGTDYSFFAAPAPFTITVMRRYVQMVWSSHLYTNERHLHKQYKIWASANYVSSSDLFSVTPVSPYFSFSPKVLDFSKDVTRIEFVATVTGVVGATTIDYIIGGRDGGWYDPIAPTPVTTEIRPLALTAAVLSIDSREDGAFFYEPTAAEIQANHIYSFVLASPVLPDSYLTVTPKSPHISFNPSSYTFHPKDAVAQLDNAGAIRSTEFYLTGLFMQMNFSVTGLAAGTHAVWFELSGDDADYYDRPANTYFTFRPMMRPSSEPGAASRYLPAPLLAICTLLLTTLFYL